MFREGDFVKCIKPISTEGRIFDLKENKIYVIRGIDYRTVYLKKESKGYSDHRFEKVLIGIFGKLWKTLKSAI